jgi:hypothetical protein
MTVTAAGTAITAAALLVMQPSDLHTVLWGQNRVRKETNCQKELLEDLPKGRVVKAGFLFGKKKKRKKPTKEPTSKQPADTGNGAFVAVAAAVLVVVVVVLSRRDAGPKVEVIEEVPAVVVPRLPVIKSGFLDKKPAEVKKVVPVSWSVSQAVGQSVGRSVSQCRHALNHQTVPLYREQLALALSLINDTRKNTNATTEASNM